MCYLIVFSLLFELNALSNCSKLTYEMGFHVFSFLSLFIQKIRQFLIYSKENWVSYKKFLFKLMLNLNIEM